MRASVVEGEHAKIDDLILDIHEKQQEAEVEATEPLEANNKKPDNERQEAEETWQLSMERLLETLWRRSNSDDDFGRSWS